MKIKDGFVLRKIADQYMAVPVGARAKELHGMIGLNETGAFIWERLSKGQSQNDIVKALCEEYEVRNDAAAASVERFLEKLRAEGMLSDE
jgi:methyltransferase-like protein